MKLSPADSRTAEALEAEFANTLFQSVERFIEAYNSGLVNKRNADVADYAQRVSAAFLNIELSAGSFSPISTEAISLNTILEGHAKWTHIVEIRNAIKEFSSEDEVKSFVISDSLHKGQLVAIVESARAIPVKNEYDEETGEETTEVLTVATPIGKVTKNAAAAEDAIGDYLEATVVTLDDDEHEAFAVSSDIASLDTSFLERVADEFRAN